MKVIRQNHVVHCDVDGTLVMHGYPEFSGQETVLVKDPVKSGEFIEVTLNKPMIRILEEELHAGTFVVVHSLGRYEWAENVLKALGLDHHDNILVMSKPLAYFDDKPVQEWLTHRVYIKPDEIYKHKE